MKIVRTKIMNLIGKKYLLFFCWLFTAPKANITEVDLNHERIHERQMKELLYIFFYLWYGVEWVVRLVQFWKVGRSAYRTSALKGLKRFREAFRKLNYMAYRNVSFEKEAYQNEEDISYLKYRIFFKSMNYL